MSKGNLVNTEAGKNWKNQCNFPIGWVTKVNKVNKVRISDGKWGRKSRAKEKERKVGKLGKRKILLHEKICVKTGLS